MQLDIQASTHPAGVQVGTVAGAIAAASAIAAPGDALEGDKA
jgi:hypothetical protein